jgi:hypothetical protein
VDFSARTFACLVALAAAVVVAGCGGDGGATTTTATSTTAAVEAVSPRPPNHRQPRKPAPRERRHDHRLGGIPKPSHRALHRARHPVGAAATVKDYVAALDAGDGERVCSLFLPGALEGLKLPKSSGGCGTSMSASIGYADPRGSPVFAGSTLEAVRSVVIDGSLARVTATIRSTFSDREPSIEDDVIYLREAAGDWRLVQPSATLYFAIGAREVPLSALAPPR